MCGRCMVVYRVLIEVFFTSTYWEKKKKKKDVWVLQATVDYTGHLENLSVDYKSHHIPASLSPSGYSVDTSAGNGLQIPSIFQSYRVRHTQIVEMDHSSLISWYTPLSDPWTALQSTFTTLLTLCFDMMTDDFCTRGCVDHRNLSSIVRHCQ